MRHCIGWLGSAVLLLAVVGCAQNSSPGAQGAAPRKLPNETVAQLHWLGTKRLAADTNAAAFMDIWKMPESVRLQKQTLDKLALAPWLLSRGPSGTNNAPANLLRPLLEDIVSEESYLEVRDAEHAGGDLVLAVRIAQDRAKVWQHNLFGALKSLADVKTGTESEGTWILKNNASTKTVNFSRVGDWTLVGMADKTNSLFTKIAQRIQASGSPVNDLNTNFWLSANLDLERISSLLGFDWNLPNQFPLISLGMEFRNGSVRSSGEFTFASPLPFKIEPWNVPTNQIFDPLISFTAVQGAQPWISGTEFWKSLKAGNPPNQFFFWAQDGMPFLSFAAAPSQNAKLQTEKISNFLLTKGNAWLTNNGTGHFGPRTNAPGVEWKDIIIMSPYLGNMTTKQSGFLSGGLVPNMLTNRPAPWALMSQVVGRTNLVYYDWEITGPRIEQWLYFGQLTRMLLKKAQVPPESAGVTWLRALEPRLGNCGTMVTRESASELAFVRNSGMGLSSVELHLLADWLESPLFPKGLNTFLGSPGPLNKGRESRTNATTTTSQQNKK